MLQAPTNEDLGRRPRVPRRDLGNDRMIESMTAREGAVCFELDLLAHAEFEQGLLIEERMELDLVHGGAGPRAPGEVLPSCGPVIVDPRRPGPPPVTGLLGAPPRRPGPAAAPGRVEGPVD